MRRVCKRFAGVPRLQVKAWAWIVPACLQPPTHTHISQQNRGVLCVLHFDPDSCGVITATFTLLGEIAAMRTMLALLASCSLVPSRRCRGVA